MSNQLDVIQAWLHSSYSVQVPNDWLAACIEWIQQEYEGQTLSVAQLQPMVFEQWLMSDLKELGASCLPADLPEQLSTQVHGPLALQVESMLDVGFPLYGQLQKVKGTLNNNIDVSADKPQQPAWEPKSSRMMLLEMTDGQTEVKGMEYLPIPAITQCLKPGCKVVIHGQVNCRRGVLMLTGENLQVLGGEVDALMETNTPVSVLERAMEVNATDNGKNAKKTFSGRFIKKNTFEQSDCKEPKHKMFQKTASAFPKPGFAEGKCGTSQARGQGWNSCAVLKPEPMTQQDVIDDEWDEDLDYGGILDEPMEEEADVKPSSSYIQSSLSASERQTKPLLKREPRDGSFETVGERFCGFSAKQSPHIVTGEHFDSMWGDDDDDFDFAQADPDVLSPVIPVQNHVNEGQNSNKRIINSSSCATVCDKSDGISNSCNLAKSASQDETPLTLVSSSAENQHRANTVTNKSSQLSSSTSSKSSLYSENLAKNSSNSGLKRTSSLSSSSMSTKPPSAKQPKLTAMLKTATKERKPEPNSTVSCSQNDSQDFVDLTDNDECYLTSADNMVKKETQLGKNPVKSKIVESKTMQKRHSPETVSVECEQQCQNSAKVCQPQEKLSLRIKSESSQDARSAEKMESGSLSFPAAAAAAQNDEIPKAVIAPFTVQGHQLSSSNDYQHLKDVQSWLQTSSEGHSTFTVKGYITTLTDRLRSCQGDSWSLSCRITDGTATIEVFIGDTVLSHLIGFSAKESITLRLQARKDPKVKETLTDGLQKCQKALIEFSGLIDVRAEAGNAKPVIINMTQLEKKKR